MKEIVKMYLEDVTGKGEYILTLVDTEGNKYQGETDAMGVQTDVMYLKLEPNE